LRGLIRRGERGDEIRAILLEALTQSAYEHGNTLKLPQRDPDRGGSATTPFLEFVRASLQLLAAGGREVLAADNEMPTAERACIETRLNEYSQLSDAALIKALARAKATILQEKPIWRGDPDNTILPP
jgi:hypothetical protein